MSGATVNSMTLAGFVIALGIVVDDAILDVENIMRRLRLARRSGDTRSTARIILDASLEMRAPIVYATLIVVAAVVPVLFMQGLTGSIFQAADCCLRARDRGLARLGDDRNAGALPDPAT